MPYSPSPRNFEVAGLTISRATKPLSSERRPCGSATLVP
jgi:hypothetical protein